MTRTMSRNKELVSRRERAVPRGPFHVAQLVVVRGRGSKVWDADGNEYIDFCGGIGVLNVGHNHPRVVAAVQAQLEELIHMSFHVAAYEGYVRLAERLNELAPIGGSKMSCFFNSGAEAVENAIKVTHHYTRRAGVVAFERGFHGRTLLTMSLTGKVHPYTAGFGPFAPEVYRLPYRPFFGRPPAAPSEIASACRRALSDLFAYHVDADAISCVIVEPVLGEGGFLPAHPAALEVLRAVTAEHGILLIADEVQTGFGRCGSLFASQAYSLEPDVLVMAKSIAGGLPLSGIVGRSEVLDSPAVGGIGGTYGGNPLACAAALAVLDVIDEESLADRARQIGERVMRVFEPLASTCAAVSDARGLGAMCGLEICDPATGSADPDRARRIAGRCLEDGLLIMTASGNVLRTLMPLNIAWGDLDRALEVLDRAVRAEG